MAKVFTNFIWRNRPSKDTALKAVNLNLMNNAINDIDTKTQNLPLNGSFIPDGYKGDLPVGDMNSGSYLRSLAQGQYWLGDGVGFTNLKAQFSVVLVWKARGNTTTTATHTRVFVLAEDASISVGAVNGTNSTVNWKKNG